MSKPLLIFLTCLGVCVLTGVFLYGFYLNSNQSYSNVSADENLMATIQTNNNLGQNNSNGQNLALNTNMSTNTNPNNTGTLIDGTSLLVKNSLNEKINLGLKKLVSITTKSNFLTKAPSAASIGRIEIMAWIYPGGQSCSAKNEYSDGRKIDILKPEYFMINEAGQLTLILENKGTCNGYSAANIVSLKKYSKEQYATISSSYAVSMDIFLTAALKDGTDIKTLVDFTVKNNLTGIEIDFEDFGGWTNPMYLNYKQFITKLGNALHEKKKKLIIDGPATANAVEEAWYPWRYADFNTLPIDRLVVMTYDYQYDQGSGQPITPISWLQNTIKWTLGRFPNKNKITVGLPSYGYKGIIGTQKFSLLTYNQIKKEPGFLTATRDSSSFEMTWQNGDNVYFYQDGESMTKKLQTIQNAGVNSVSIWHLGGNLWFE